MVINSNQTEYDYAMSNPSVQTLRKFVELARYIAEQAEQPQGATLPRGKWYGPTSRRSSR